MALRAIYFQAIIYGDPVCFHSSSVCCIAGRPVLAAAPSPSPGPISQPALDAANTFVPMPVPAVPGL